MPGQGVKSGCDTLGVSIAFSSRERDKWVENFQTWPTPQFPFFFFFLKNTISIPFIFASTFCYKILISSVSH
jgi:hypothetical protein